MHYLALATDYDGTLAHHGQVDESTIATLRRLLASGRQLLLVTGREVEELQAIFRHLELFQCVVAENGAVLFYPGSGEITALAAPPPPTFVRALQQRGGAGLAALRR